MLERDARHSPRRRESTKGKQLEDMVDESVELIGRSGPAILRPTRLDSRRSKKLFNQSSKLSLCFIWSIS